MGQKFYHYVNINGKLEIPQNLSKDDFNKLFFGFLLKNKIKLIGSCDFKTEITEIPNDLDNEPEFDF